MFRFINVFSKVVGDFIAFNIVLTLCQNMVNMTA